MLPLTWAHLLYVLAIGAFVLSAAPLVRGPWLSIGLGLLAAGHLAS